MKQVIVNIPEHKYQFFQELIQSLGYEAYSQEVIITPAIDAAIEHELHQIAEEPSYLLDWNEARKSLRRHGGNA